MDTGKHHDSHNGLFNWLFYRLFHGAVCLEGVDGCWGYSLMTAPTSPASELADLIGRLEKAQWTVDPSCCYWVLNSLKARRTEMMAAASACRRAYKSPHLGDPAIFLAETYEHVADIYARAIDALQSQAEGTG